MIIVILLVCGVVSLSDFVCFLIPAGRCNISSLSYSNQTVYVNYLFGGLVLAHFLAFIIFYV